MRVLLLLPALVLVACLGVLLAAARHYRPQVVDDDYGPVGAFRLSERGGRLVSDEDLRGRVWLAGFVFTRCTGPCPQVSGTMARLQSELAGEADFRLVTFTVDPGHDDPGELVRYASHFQADPDRWLFLTGTEEEVYGLLRHGFKVTAMQNEGAQRRPGSEVLHDTRLVLVDKRGRIRGYFEGIRDSREDDPDAAFEANLGRLREKVGALLREGD